MTVFIGVVSHGHGDIINELDCLSRLSNDFVVVVKSNIKDGLLSKYCIGNNIHLIDNDYFSGFGENNNIIYNYCVCHLNMTHDDFFIVLNPDVYIEGAELIKLTELMSADSVKFATINLYADASKTTLDYSVRRYPTAMIFFRSLFFPGERKKYVVNKECITQPTIVDWGAGSFLAFKAEHYKNLRGFDENYFMYCEDVDICYRSKKDGVDLIYYPSVSAIHYARHDSRRFFSKSFFWHIKSAIRFLASKNRLVKFRSKI